MRPTSPTAPTTVLRPDYSRGQHGAFGPRRCSVHNFAIVDEVDFGSDRRGQDLIIPGPADGARTRYAEFARLAPLMKKDVHYEVDSASAPSVHGEIGVESVEDQLGIDNLYEAANSPLVSYLNNALQGC